VEFRSERSGLAETKFDVTVVAVDEHGSVLLAVGDRDEPFYFRSAVKPLQATVALEAGLSVPPEHLAVMCSSHGGFPAHVAIVDRILGDAGLDASALATPATWPFADEARLTAITRGARTPKPVYHNCSGKHAGWLAACRSAGLPTAGYSEADHPIQRAVSEVIAAATGAAPAHIGIDGCGAPTHAGSVLDLATAFSRISTDDRFAAVAAALQRFPALVADATRPDGLFGRWWDGPAKIGAAGVMAVARQGTAIVAKAWSGSDLVSVAAVTEAALRLGMISAAAGAALEPVVHPTVLGGGRSVGTLTTG